MVVDGDDKYDFPELGGKRVEKKKEVDKSRTQLTSEQYKETFVY